MRLIIASVLLCLAFPFLTPGTRLSNFGGTTAEDNMTVGYTDLSLASTTSGWSDLYGAVIADGARNPVEYELASYSGDPVLSTAPSDGNSVGPADTSIYRDKPDRITGITAIMLLIGALRLYFTSPGFRKFLFDTFSPLSPLGY